MVELFVKDDTEEVRVFVDPQDQEHVPAPLVARARRRPRAFPEVFDPAQPAILPPLDTRVELPLERLELFPEVVVLDLLALLGWGKGALPRQVRVVWEEVRRLAPQRGQTRA